MTKTVPKKPTNTAEYLATLTPEQRKIIEQLRKTIRAAVPEAEEWFSYGIPGFRFRGRTLVWVAAWKHHYSMYPVSAEQVAALAESGEVFEVEKGTLRFPSDAKIPYGLVTRLVKARARATLPDVD